MFFFSLLYEIGNRSDDLQLFTFPSDAYIPLFSMLIFCFSTTKKKLAAYFHSPVHAFSIVMDIFCLKVHFAGTMIMIEIKKGIIGTDHGPHQWRDLGTNPDHAQKGLNLHS